MRLVISSIHSSAFTIISQSSAFTIINQRKLLRININQSLDDFTQTGYEYLDKFLNYTVYGTIESPINGILE